MEAGLKLIHGQRLLPLDMDVPDNGNPRHHDHLPSQYNRYSDSDLQGHHQLALAPRLSGDWYELANLPGHPHQHPPPPFHAPHPLGPKTHWQKFKDFVRSVLAFTFSNVGIIVLVIGYLLMGAAVFEEIEGPGEVGIEFFVTNYRNNTVKRLWHITEKYNTLHKPNWTNEVKVIVDEFYNHILEQVGEGYAGSDIPAPKWTFSGALLYSITVITTIGKLVNCKNPRQLGTEQKWPMFCLVLDLDIFSAFCFEKRSQGIMGNVRPGNKSFLKS